MRMLVTGVRDGKSCVVREIDCAPDDGGMVVQLLDLDVVGLPPRPSGQGEHFVSGFPPPGTMRWMRVRFAPAQASPMHHTDSVDCHTIVAGSIEMILDDGAHRLTVGDSVVMNGLDHAWRAGPEGCSTSILIFGTPPRADA